MNVDDQAPDRSLTDRLDALVADYCDALNRGETPDRDAVLRQVPPAARPGLERALKMIEAGAATDAMPARPLVAGLRLGAFELQREVGRGGMAVVWLARDTELDRAVAVKVLRPGLALERRHVDRFRREALAIARLEHPHVVAIHGVGVDEGVHWLAMEFVAGPSLATVLEALPSDRPRTPDDLARALGVAPDRDLDPHAPADYERAVARLLAPIAGALDEAHRCGLVHRDVKPSNILIHRDGRAVVADFGLAKGEGDAALSLTGEGLGTPHYMSPEQAHLTGRAVDHRTDVYSLGVTLYEALAGRRPFAGTTFLEVVESIRSTQPPPLRALAPDRSRDAAAVTRRAMAREPEQRYPTARALRDDLAALGDGRATAARTAEGGALRRMLAELGRGRDAAREFVSETALLGRPLVHIHSGPRPAGRPPRVARGWIAIGDVAHGVVFAGGGRAYSLGLSCGGVAVGTFAWGGIAAGMFTFAGIAAGVVNLAGVGAGALTFGGVAIGAVAFGGVAIGRYAEGGLALGQHTIDSRGADPAAVEFFERLFDSFGGFWSTLLGG